MPEAGLWIDGIVNAVAALAFLAVGIALCRRDVAPRAYLANLGFSGFWIAYGVNLAFASWRIIRVAAGQFDVLSFVVTFVVETGIAVLALYGLYLHLAYVRTGNYPGHLVVLVLVGAVAVTMGAIVVGHGPSEVVVEDWRTDLEFSTPLPDAVRWGMVGTYYGALLVAAFQLMTLGHRVGGEARKRATALGWALILLAAMDAIILGPDEAVPFGYLATAGKLAAVGIVAKMYLVSPIVQVRTSNNGHS